MTTTRLVNINLKDDVLKEIDAVVSNFGFTNRSEFIRSVIREKLEEYKVKKAIMSLSKSRGVIKNSKVFTSAEYEKAREDAFEKLYRRIQ